jgi:hypothetical protein
MMRVRTLAIPVIPGRRLGLATAAAVIVAAFAPTSALAGLDDLTNLADADATVENVTSTVSELTAPVANATQTPTPAAPAPAAPAPPASQPSAVQQVTTPFAPVVSETVAPLTKPLEAATAPVANTTDHVVKTAAPVVATVQPAVSPVTAPVAQATAPLVQTVQQTAQPVVNSVQPVLDTVQQATTPVLATVAQTAAPVLTAADQAAAPTMALVSPLLQQTEQTATQVIAPVVDEAGQALGPVVKATDHVAAPLVSTATQGTSRMGPVQDTTTPIRDPGSAGGPTQQSGVVEPARGTPSIVVMRPHASPTQRPPRGSTPHVSGPAPLAGFGSALVTQGSTADASSGPRQATASRPTGPRGPFAPGRPFGFSAAPATGGASFFVPLFAVVAAILLLAAQGVGRRLRPALASPQLPILALSLERPG